jgi:hypothetical protein
LTVLYRLTRLCSPLSALCSLLCILRGCKHAALTPDPQPQGSSVGHHTVKASTCKMCNGMSKAVTLSVLYPPQLAPLTVQIMSVKQQEKRVSSVNNKRGGCAVEQSLSGYPRPVPDEASPSLSSAPSPGSLLLLTAAALQSSKAKAHMDDGHGLLAI